MHPATVDDHQKNVNMHHTNAAIVTGGGSGIGLAIASKFVAEGKKTIIIGRNQAKLDDAAKTLGSLCVTVQADLTDLPAMPQLVQSIISTHGPFDTLVNNAGINMKKEIQDVSDEDFQTVMHTNVNALFSISREVIKYWLRETIGGSIINISSMASQYGIPKVIAYTASKTAIDGMTRAMASELSVHNIRINSIAPGFIATAMSAKALNDDPERMQKVMGRTPMKRLGLPEEVASLAWFLAGSEASFITGTIIPVDGGNSIGF